MRKWLADLKPFHPIVHTLILGTMMARIGSSMSMPFLALLLVRDAQMEPAAIGLTIGASSLAGTFGGFVGGALSDRIGRRRVMLAAQYSWGFVLIGFAFAQHPAAFVALNMLNGLCRSFFEPVSQALIGDLTPPDRRLRAYSLRYVAINIGVAVGPLLGAWFGLVAGRLPFVITGTVYLVYAVVLDLLLRRFGLKQIQGKQREAATIGDTIRTVGSDAALRLYLAGGLLVAVGYSQMTATLSQHLDRSFASGASLFALLMSVNAVTVVLSQMPLSRWAERRSPIAALQVGVVLYAFGSAGFALADSWPSMIAAMVVFTWGEVLTFPAGAWFIDRLAPEHMRGSYFGAQTLTSLGHFIGPWVGGLMLAEYGGRILFLAMAGIMLASIVFYRGGEALYRKRTAGG
ncbi:MDR family MFS transporter [Paenibacillus thermoaerophilus]|uniref:MDR family MFS transporter n=1 Tax=Paenibacillus thermoaerophilus TaxID=1215385 RepID=A0ABW2V1V7_9BACL|nr:MFS transporter [Paenibacillus thermoaerophilus]TMV18238.1 MFS transporter [Paenibacillus thermoaerophilus]